VSNPNPDALKARQAKKRKSKPKDLKAVAAIVWDALETARALLENEDPQMQLKACHGVFQGATAYAKVYEVGELEARLEALEVSMPNQKPGSSSSGLRRVA
jgi:phage terminase large subunit-like protein